MLIDLLREALDARRLLSFDYDSTGRLVEPHAIGLNKAGQLVLRGYQVATMTTPNSVDWTAAGWRLFILEKASFITVRTDFESLAPRPGYKTGDKLMATILAELPEPQDFTKPALNDGTGHCRSCGRDNNGYEGKPCARDCPMYWEELGIKNPEFA